MEVLLSLLLSPEDPTPLKVFAHYSSPVVLGSCNQQSVKGWELVVKLVVNGVVFSVVILVVAVL